MCNTRHHQISHQSAPGRAQGTSSQRGRLWKSCGRGQGLEACPAHSLPSSEPAQLRAWAAGQSSPTVSCDSPSPMPEFSRTPQENHMAEERVRASSSSSSLFTLNRPNGLENKMKNPSHSLHPHSQCSPLCPTCPGAALCPSFLQTVPCPRQLFPLPGTSPVLTCDPVWLTLVLVPSPSLQTRKII